VAEVTPSTVDENPSKSTATHTGSENRLKMNTVLPSKKFCNGHAQIDYMNKTIINVPSVKFLGLLVDDTLSWEKHINHIASKLSSACYAVQALTPLLSRNTLKMLYFSYAHSFISYGIIFWGTSTNIIKIFRL
jgi:hypothetical protein